MAAKNHSTLAHWSQYLGLRAIAGFMQFFDVDQNLHTAASTGSLYHRFASRLRGERAEANISRCFPEMPEAMVRETAVRATQHMIQLFGVEAMVSPRLITPGSWSRYVRLGPNIAPALDLLVRGKPAIFITGHVGNWELLGTVLAAMGYPLVALARPLDNPLINRWLLAAREAHGQRIITKWGATPILEGTLASGGRVGFIADQNAGDGGLFVPFFGRLASSYKSIALLAMRHQVPVICGCAIRLGERFSYELDVTDIIHPHEWSNQQDPVYYITARYNRAMEAMIRRDPTQYLWLHRRWKSRPRYERQGQPMPPRLMDKLRSLPWMAQSELDRIVLNSNVSKTAAH